MSARQRLHILVPLTAALLSGCASVIEYTPREDVVVEVGIDAARLQFKELVQRAAVPSVTFVEVTDDFYHYGWLETIHGVYGIPMGSVPRENQVFFNNIETLEIYTNHWVFLWAPGRRIQDKILFGTGQDARHFADLVTSLRQWRRRGTPP